MDTLQFKIPLRVMLNKPVFKNSYPEHMVNMDELDFNSISKDEIDNLDAQYDWIEAWHYRDYDKQMSGFNNKDVQMEVAYDKGNYIVTLISDNPFDTIVRNNHYYTSNPNDFKEVTLKEAVVRYLEGCISDGIGENKIGYITYQGEECDVWLGELTEI